jgi:hypothetical protein
MPTRISDLPEYTTITGSAFVPIVDINEQVASKNKKIRIDDLRKYFFTGTTTSSSFTEHTPGLYYFGDNSDGPLNLTGSITNVRTFVSRSFASTQDGVPIVKNFSSLFISRSVVVSPTLRCRGMLIFVDGDATISGSLRMTGRGAKFTGSDASFTTINPPYLGDYWSTQLFPSASYLSRVFAVGAPGGAGSATSPGIAGPAGILGRSGGGGAGGGLGGTFPGSGGSGAAGTSFSGGSGGGGGNAAPTTPRDGGAGRNFGGAGGTSAYSGGAGNPNGPAGTSPGGEGTGGLLILIVRGNLKIGPNGSIAANGITGMTGGTPSPGACGGGGSGGGILYVYYGGTLTNNGTVTANGGSGGSGAVVGGAGGAGTAIISKLNVAFPVGN